MEYSVINSGWSINTGEGVVVIVDQGQVAVSDSVDLILYWCCCCLGEEEEEERRAKKNRKNKKKEKIREQEVLIFQRRRYGRETIPTMVRE